MARLYFHVLLIMVAVLTGDAYCRQQQEVRLGASRELLDAAALTPLELFTSAYNTIMDGVAGRNLSRSATASIYAIWSENAFPLALASGGLAWPAVAGAQQPSGSRLVAFGHEALLIGCCGTGDELDTLVVNAFKWLADTRSNPANSTIRLATTIPTVNNLGIIAQSLSKVALVPAVAKYVDLNAFVTNGGSDIDILWIDTYTEYTPAQVTAILKFAKQAGKGLVVGGHAWYWGYSHPGANMFVDKKVNQILWPLGLAVTTDARLGFYPPPATPTADWLWYSAQHVLSAVLSAAQTGGNPILPAAELVSGTAVGQLLNMLPLRSQSAASGLTATWKLLDQVRSAAIAIGPQNPFYNGAANFAQKLPVSLGTWTIRNRVDVTTIYPSPSAALYPGALPAGTPTTTATVSIRATFTPPDNHFAYAGTATPLWRSTGLYAPPGPAITVTVKTPAALNKGLKIQIGAHTDDLSSRNPWLRMPYIAKQFDIGSSSSMQINNPMGGLIFVLVPAGLSLGTVQISFRGVVRTPSFKLNDSVADWESTVRNYAAPWGELDSGKMIFTLPSAALRGIADPTPLLNHWNKVLDAMAWLANVQYFRTRRERFVVDADLAYESLSGIHAGYPMVALDSPAVRDEVTSLTSLKTKGSWKLFNALAANHIRSETIFSNGCIVSLEMLFTIRAMEKSGVNLNNTDAWSMISPAARATTRAAYLAAGAKWSTSWTVWAALDTYLQLREGFSWSFYRRVHLAYEQMGSSLPDNLVDTWIQTTCKTAGVNLVPFYTKWGFPVGQSSVAVCSVLPPWKKDPMNQTPA